MREGDELEEVILKENGKTYDAVVNREKGYVDIPINEAVSRRFRIEDIELPKK